MKKIGIVNVYFGKLPNYFCLWLKSCEKNPSIDFLVFSDCYVDVLPGNVKIYPITLKEIQRRAEALLGFEVVLDRPYKCCDYKPIYGLIFSDYLKDYDYWGHCDLDLIFGDLEGMFDKYQLYNYDRFLPLGHLSLYRNIPEVNERYKCSGSNYNYKQTFTTDKITVFDEMPGMTSVYLKNGFSMFTKRIFADIASIYNRFRVIEGYDLDIKPKNYKQQIFYWEDGKIYRAYSLKQKIYKEEYIYIHFKKRPNYSVLFDFPKTDGFYITNKGFIPKNGEVTNQIIRDNNIYPGGLYEFCEKLRYKVCTLYSKIKNHISRLMKYE